MNNSINIQKEALSAEREGAWLQEMEQSDEFQISNILHYLAPWIEKTDGGHEDDGEAVESLADTG